jgi:hypothetical protein
MESVIMFPLIAPNQLDWMMEHLKLVDPDGPDYQTTRIGDSVVEWGPHEGGFLGSKKPRHMVMSSSGWPKPEHAPKEN